MARKTPQNPEAVPKAKQARFDVIAGMIEAFCKDHLNEEYAALGREMAAALARKRPSPLDRGRPESWAAGIVYAIGGVNFLFDPSQSPHRSAGDLCAAFGVSQSTGSAKATEIRKLLDLMPMDPRWCLPSRLIENPMAWFVQVNGLLVDARRLPRPLQEEAFRKGLIPFIPDDGPP